MSSRTAGQHSFAQVPSVQMQRSSFNRSCGTKTTFDAGQLIPIFCDEALPGDTINMRTSIFARLATQLHPVMDNMMLDTFWFAVPMRLLWDNWQKFNGEQDNPDDSTDFLIPTITKPAPGHAVGGLSDHIGIPPLVEVTHSAMWHRAYNLIYKEWFRDQNLQDSPIINTGDGPDNPDDYFILNRGKRHDYMTSCLPWPQKGDAVTIGFGDTATVTLDSGQNISATGNGSPSFNVTGGIMNLSTIATNENVLMSGNVTGNSVLSWSNPATRTLLDGVTGVADLSTATAQTINALREAFQLQRLLERDARGGTRYTEIIRSHFGVVSPDARLQRPEYLGGNSFPINVNPVANTTDIGLEVGDLASYATAQSSGSNFTKSFTEHCIIIGMVSARCDLNYQQGLERQFSRSTKYDFFWPALAHLGEMAVLNKEIYLQGTAEDEEVFGYQERFAEYRYKPSTISGKFRSVDPTSLDVWHLAQDFENLPVLNEEFILEDPPFDRMIAVPGEVHFLFDAFFQFIHARPMPTFSVPGMIDHF